jgi:tetratricopeptide (TPR) repeat protein
VERARLALAREQPAQALVALETLSPVPEGRADFWLMKGSAHLGLGQLDAAEKAFAAAQPLAPGNAQIAVQRAILKQEKGDHAGALQILQDAAARDSSVPEIYLNLGYSQQELGAFSDARRSFRIFLRTTEGRSLYAQQREAVSRWLRQFSAVSQ